jgi:hypothetical protein
MPEGNPPTRLRDMQLAFAGHIRDPERMPAPDGIENRRMKIYRELFFNNVSSMLSSNFPVLRTLYEDEDWSRLMRDFFSVHRCQTPLFPELPKEFLRYLQDERVQRDEDPPFLQELAHYEWVELALELDEREIDDVEADRQGNMLNGVPVLSPLAWPLSYRFPVHLIKADFRPAEAPEDATHLLVYRNREDDVKFMQLNEVTRYLLNRMQQHPEETGLQLLNHVADALQHPDREKLIIFGTQLFEDLRNKDVLLGTREKHDV